MSSVMQSPRRITSHQSYRLLQIGVALFIFCGLEGFVIPALPVPQLGRSVHTLSALQGIITITLGAKHFNAPNEVTVLR